MTSSFLSVGASIAENGDRHVRMGLAHYADGRPAYAAGSFAKALRNYERAFSCSELFAPKPLIEEFAAAHLKAVVQSYRADHNPS